jgi:hypothetical protein
LAGEVIEDAHELKLNETLPAGEYALLAGLYDAATGRRLATTPGQQDRVRLTSMHLGK